MREKQIEEMAKVINLMKKRNAHYYDERTQEHEAFADCENIAEALYEMGYRKREDVVEDLFKEIGKAIYNLERQYEERNKMEYSTVVGFAYKKLLETKDEFLKAEE